ncbi:MAG TPA: hypothetical protein PKW95_00035 [bacterium]|nr:hypothetical protein [bacterium]
MIRQFVCVSLCLILLGLLAAPAHAYRYWGTKPLGMGGAYSAMADDASAIHWNPAGLTIYNDKKRVSLDFNYERHQYLLGDYKFLYEDELTVDEDDSFAGEYYFDEPDPVDWNERKVRDLYHLSLIDGKTTKVMVAGLAFTAYNFPMNTFQEGSDYSADLALAFGNWEMFSFGMTGRYQATAEDSTGEFDMDVGALLNAGPVISIAAVGRNIFGNDEPRLVRREIVLGVAGHALDYASLSVESSKVFDVTDVDGTFNFAVGAEGKPVKQLALRAGFDWDQVDSARLWSLGVAFLDVQGSLGYTFQGDIDEVRNYVHSLQVSIMF